MTVTAVDQELSQRAAVEGERLSGELERCVATAFSRQGLIEKNYRIHGQGFRLRFAGTELAKKMTRALAHLEVDGIETVSLTLNCWDVAGSGVACPQPRWPSSLFTGRGEIRGLDGPGMRIAYFDWLKLLNVYFPGTGQAYYCLPEAEPFPVQQYGSPALTVFSWWCNTLDWQFTHAAAVGTERGAILIVGQGGAGKSTLAFSTLGTELSYLSDDYCVLAPGKPPQVLALYNSGKLTEASLALLPHLRPRAANAGESGREKAVFFLHEKTRASEKNQSPLRAVVLSCLNSRETRLLPVDAREIVQVVGDSTLRQLAGSGRMDFFRMARLLRDLPTYRLLHGPDAAATHQLLLSLCES